MGPHSLPCFCLHWHPEIAAILCLVLGPDGPSLAATNQQNYLPARGLLARYLVSFLSPPDPLLLDPTPWSHDPHPHDSTILSSLLLCPFLTGSYSVVPAGLELLPQPPECKDLVYVPSHLAPVLLFKPTIHFQARTIAD